MEGWFYINSSSSNIDLNHRLWQVGANVTNGMFFGYNLVIYIFGRGLISHLCLMQTHSNDQWVHIAIVRDNSSLRWFRNGVQVATYNGSNWNWDMSREIC